VAVKAAFLIVNRARPHRRSSAPTWASLCRIQSATSSYCRKYSQRWPARQPDA